MSGAKIDRGCQCVTIDDTGLIRIDQVPIFRLTRIKGHRGWFVQIIDRNKGRSGMRGTNCINVSFTGFLDRILEEMADT